jgi:RsiW-degrading membrane proteinase PrsW (M82 family)
MVMGVIVAAQIVNSKENMTQLNAADIAGGVAGILLGGVYILPFFGIEGVLVMVFVVKVLPFFCVWRGGIKPS